MWTLSTAVTKDKIRLFLDDALVQGLDGEWVNNGDSYPSGDGIGGGDFNFRINVLGGDVNQDGVVNASDLGSLRQKLNRNASNPGSGAGGYSPFADLNADGTINARDLGLWRQRINNRLPSAEPAALW